MWVYNSKIGALYIKPLNNGRFGFFFNNELWESSHTLEAEADNIANFSTNCYEWDSMEGLIDFPVDLSEWHRL